MAPERLFYLLLLVFIPFDSIPQLSQSDFPITEVKASPDLWVFAIREVFKIYVGSIQISKLPGGQNSDGNILRGNEAESLNVFFLGRYVVFTLPVCLFVF